MKHFTKRILSLLLAAMLTLSLAACGGGGDTGTGAGGGGQTASNSGVAAGETPTITFYPSAANVSSGLVGGYKGDYFASRGFNLEVWAYSDEKTNAILTSGDLPDVMFVPTESVDILIQSGALLDLEPYLDQMPHLMEYEYTPGMLNYVRQFRSNGTGGVYGLMTAVGPNYNAYKWVDSSERNAVKINWEHYVGIGAPKINSFDDLIDVMEQMQKAYPTDAEGNPYFGTILNAGSDTQYWACMTMWYRMQGYLESQLPYLLEADMVNGTVSSILSKDSLYYKGLKWYNEVYRRGLMDPDSINNDRATQKVKVDNGLVQVPSGYLPGWATTFLEYYIPGTDVYYNSTSTYGDTKYLLCVNAKTQKLDACLAYLDMLSDPDAYLIINNGPEGDYWYADDNGNAYFTDAGLAWIKENGGIMTGFKLQSGEELALWNTPHIIRDGSFTSYGDGEGGKRCASTIGWEEVNELSVDNDTYRSWQQVTGYETWKDWLGSHFHDSGPLDNVFSFCSLPDDMMELTISAIREKVTQASWQMVYSDSEAKFDQIWDSMIADCEGLDAQSVIDWRLADIENAKTIRDSLA